MISGTIRYLHDDVIAMAEAGRCELGAGVSPCPFEIRVMPCHDPRQAHIPCRVTLAAISGLTLRALGSVRVVRRKSCGRHRPVIRCAPSAMVNARLRPNSRGVTSGCCPAAPRLPGKTAAVNLSLG